MAAIALSEAAEEFLAQPRIAVAGVSRDPKQPANLVYRRLRDAGHEVFAVNPNAELVEGDRCFPAVTAIPGGVDGVVIVTTPAAAEDVVSDCAAAGVPRVWLHRGLGPGSTSESAVALCRRHEISVIPGGCPNMFGDTADRPHRCMHAMLRLTGKVPGRIDGYGRPYTATGADAARDSGRRCSSPKRPCADRPGGSPSGSRPG